MAAQPRAPEEHAGPRSRRNGGGSCGSKRRNALLCPGVPAARTREEEIDVQMKGAALRRAALHCVRLNCQLIRKESLHVQRAFEGGRVCAVLLAHAALQLADGLVI